MTEAGTVEQRGRAGGVLDPGAANARIGRGVPAQVPSVDEACACSLSELSAYEHRLRQVAQDQRLVVQKRRSSLRTAGARVYRLRHWMTGHLLVTDTPAPRGEPGDQSSPDEWIGIRYVHAIVLNLDVAGRIDRWWNQLTVEEWRRVLDNREHLPERYVAGLSAAGIGGVSQGRLPRSVRDHLDRIGVR